MNPWPKGTINDDVMADLHPQVDLVFPVHTLNHISIGDVQNSAYIVTQSLIPDDMRFLDSGKKLVHHLKHRVLCKACRPHRICQENRADAGKLMA
jgi:hypothetical protein